MDGAVWGFIGVVVGGLITGLVTLFAESIRADKDASLDSAKREDDRMLARDNFERDTLLALQDAIDDLNTVLVKLSSLAREERDQALVDRHRITSGRVITLRSRVADDQIRDAVGEYVHAIGDVTRVADPDARQAAFTRAGQHAHIALERCGELIRATFRVPVVTTSDRS